MTREEANAKAIEMVRDALIPMPEDVTNRVAASSDEGEIERILQDWMEKAFAQFDRQLEALFARETEAN